MWSLTYSDISITSFMSNRADVSEVWYHG